MEAHSTGVQHAYDRAKQVLRLETDRAASLREAILACRKGGVVSVLGVFGVTDKFPMGAIMNKGLRLRVRAYDMFKKKTDGCIRVALRP